MRIVDLSAEIKQSPDELPEPLRTEIAFVDHRQGGKDIENLLGVPRDLLRNREGWAVETFKNFGTHNSTHVDAPWHYNSTIGGEPAQTIDELSLEWFYRPGVVLDMTSHADGEVVTVESLTTELKRIDHEISEREIILIRTDRDRFYEEPDYMVRGPGVTAEATRWLFDRGVRVMGIDAWGWDAPLHLQAEEAKRRGEPNIFWAAHQVDLPYCQIERLVNLSALPATGFTIACFPLKIVGGSAGPARVVAIFED